MKRHYPVEFLAASMTLDLNNTDKLSDSLRGASGLGNQVEAPNINRSGATFEVSRRHHPLRAGRAEGRRPQAVELIVEERRKACSPRSPISPRG